MLDLEPWLVARQTSGNRASPLVSAVINTGTSRSAASRTTSAGPTFRPRPIPNVDND
jgi:hypothetical protein